MFEASIRSLISCALPAKRLTGRVSMWSFTVSLYP
jgi:hypothetical protein